MNRTPNGSMNGICTLANDRVYHQLVALLNSIEAMMGPEMPVCVFPYDDQVDRIAAEIDRRPHVQLFQNQAIIAKWDAWVRDIWDAHPTARQRWGNPDPSYYHRIGTHRRFCAFDGPFDRFVYMDADTLLLSSLDQIFAQLDRFDWVVYDFQFTDPVHVYDLAAPRLMALFDADRLREIFCSGFYASKRHVFSSETLDWLRAELRSGDASVLYPLAPDQTILNYMVMKANLPSNNLALTLPLDRRTGCCVTSPHFTEQHHLLYDQANRLTYLHYIGISSRHFNRLCNGENVHFPYRDLFLHYRYLHQPPDRPALNGKPVLYNQSLRLPERLFRKLKPVLTLGGRR